MSEKSSIKESSSSRQSKSTEVVKEEKFHILHSPGYPRIENQKRMEDAHGVDQVVWLDLKLGLLVFIIFLLFKFDLNTITQFVTEFIDLIITIIHT